jgi:hypothetical protein
MEAEQMQAQIRIYTINKGELDTFVKHFKEETKPIHDKVGWPVVASWINRPQNEFIWIRTHEDAADLEAKTKAFRQAIGRGDYARHQRREDGSPRSRAGLDGGMHGCRTPRNSGREHGPPGRCTRRCSLVMCPSTSEAMASGAAPARGARAFPLAFRHGIVRRHGPKSQEELR